MPDAQDGLVSASIEDASLSTYVLKYDSPYEFDDDDGPGHEICWSESAHEFKAENDDEARAMADSFLNDPSNVLVVGGERGVPSMISLSKLL